MSTSLKRSSLCRILWDTINDFFFFVEKQTFPFIVLNTSGTENKIGYRDTHWYCGVLHCFILHFKWWNDDGWPFQNTYSLYMYIYCIYQRFKMIFKTPPYLHLFNSGSLFLWNINATDKHFMAEELSLVLLWKVAVYFTFVKWIYALKSVRILALYLSNIKPFRMILIIANSRGACWRG